MERIDKIIRHELFQYHLQENNTAEADRRFCRHNMGHFLDVARIGWIFVLEEKLNIDRELVYAAALLHDLGRHVQYAQGTPHEAVSAEIAPQILAACGFDDKEASVITDAILSHRNSTVAEEKSLRGILYRADKASRTCFACEAEQECDWGSRKKNLTVRY